MLRGAGGEGRAWHQQCIAEVGAQQGQTTSTKSPFGPPWRWARKRSGLSLPTTNQHGPRGHPPCEALLTTSELPSATVGSVQKGIGVLSPCQRSPASPQSDQVVRFQTLPFLQGSLLTANTSRKQGLNSSLFGSVLPGHDSNLACYPANFPRLPMQHMNHLHSDIPTGAGQQVMQAGDFVAQCITFLLPAFQARGSCH